MDLIALTIREYMRGVWMMGIRGTVVCDEAGCDWRQETDDLRGWYKKPCPKCGGGEIVNNEENAILCIAELSERAGLFSQDPDADGLNIRIDTTRRKKG